MPTDDDWLTEWLAHCERGLLRLQIQRNLSEHFCAVCGAEMEIAGEELHCKKICASCGAKRDCSDP